MPGTFTEYGRKTLKDLVRKVNKLPFDFIRSSMESVVKVMQKYPRKRPFQKYIRTDTFKNAWELNRTPSYFEIKNFAEQKGIVYPSYVVGDATGQGQAWMHVGRWKVFRQVFEDVFSRLPKSIYDRLKVSHPYIKFEEGP
jgi:hypothetical protein